MKHILLWHTSPYQSTTESFIRLSVVFSCLVWMNSVSLARGTFREVAFDEGSSMNPWATGEMGFRSRGLRIEKPLRGRWWGAEIDEYEGR
jgi:hypothetical protein